MLNVNLETTSNFLSHFAFKTIDLIRLSSVFVSRDIYQNKFGNVTDLPCRVPYYVACG